MILEVSKELTRQAMKSKCVICHKQIRAWQLWKYSEKGEKKNFVHYNCLYPSKNKNEGELNG